MRRALVVLLLVVWGMGVTEVRAETPTRTPTRTITLTRTPTETPTVTMTPANTGTARSTPAQTPTPNEHAVLYWKALQTLSVNTAIYHHSGNFTPIGKTDFALPFDGKVDLLSVSCAPPVSAGSQEFRLMLDDATAALTCTMSGGQSSCADASNTVTFTAGQRLNMRSLAGLPSGNTATDCTIVARLRDSGGNPYDSAIHWGGGGAASLSQCLTGSRGYAVCGGDGGTHACTVDRECGGQPNDGCWCSPGNDVDNSTECLGGWGWPSCDSSEATARANSFTIPGPAGTVMGQLSGMTVHLTPAAGNTETYTLVNVTAGMRDMGLVTTLAAGNTQATGTCSGDCWVYGGDNLVVRYNVSGSANTFGNRNIAVTIDGPGQILTTRRNVNITTSSTIYGNVLSPFVDTVNTIRAEQCTQFQNLTVDTSGLPAGANFTTQLCQTSGNLPRTCTTSTGLSCMVSAGQTVCHDDVNTPTLFAGDFYTQQIVTTGSTGGPPDVAMELVDGVGCSPSVTPTDTPTETPTDTPTVTNTPVDSSTPTDTPTETPSATASDTPTITLTPIDTDTPTPTPSPQPVGTLQCCDCGPEVEAACNGSCPFGCTLVDNAVCP